MTLDELNAAVEVWHIDADAIDPPQIGTIFDALSHNPMQWSCTDQRVLLEMFRDGLEYGTIERVKLARFLDDVAIYTRDPYALASWRAVRIELPVPTNEIWIEFFQDLISCDSLRSVEAIAVASGKLRRGDELFFGAVIGLLASAELPGDVRFRMRGLIADYCGDKNTV